MAAESATLRSFLIVLAIGAMIIVPSLVLLYRTFSEKTGGPGSKVGDAMY